MLGVSEKQQGIQGGWQGVWERGKEIRTEQLCKESGLEVVHWGTPPMFRVLACEKSRRARSKATVPCMTQVLAVESVLPLLPGVLKGWWWKQQSDCSSHKMPPGGDSRLYF